MLQYLKIRNLALLDEADLEFDRGFTAVTGETGAGKSVLLGALSLLSGARTDRSVIRQGEDQCEVEAGLFFTDDRVDQINERLAEANLPLCEEGSLILRRSISRSRMSKIQVNNRLATLAVLQNIGEFWIDFHGPGEPQKLFYEKWQLAFLDLYAKAKDELAGYNRVYHEWRELLREISDLRQKDQLSEDEVEYLQTQIEKIDSLELESKSIDQLERDFQLLSGAQELISLSKILSEGLAGDSGVSVRLGELLQSARNLSEIDPQSVSLADRLESLIIEMEDVAVEYRELAARCEFDEETAQTVEKRMELWLEVQRRYGPTLESVLGKRAELVRKIESQGDIEGTLNRLTEEAAGVEKQAREIAEVIRKKRFQASRVLAGKVSRLAGALGFKKSDFQIEVVSRPELTMTGNSTCQFLFSPNTGQGLMPLQKIASSGEIARIMLALKAVLAALDETPLLVFDEVDSNIGGETAGTVGRELENLGDRHQVICVTHLPQVAARGRNHFVVEKEQDEKETRISIRPVSGKSGERIVEIARMLGDRKSEAALSHARELLGG